MAPRPTRPPSITEASQAVGPRSVSRPTPSDPVDSQKGRMASAAVASATNTPRARVDRVSEAQRRGIFRESHSSKWFSPSRSSHQPARKPPATGRSRNSQDHAGSSPTGSAVSTGMAGCGPTRVCRGATTDPIPRLNPAPVVHANVHIARFGMMPSWATVTTAPPQTPAFSSW